jgi:hypothetical protein
MTTSSNDSPDARPSRWRAFGLVAAIVGLALALAAVAAIVSIVVFLTKSGERAQVAATAPASAPAPTLAKIEPAAATAAALPAIAGSSARPRRVLLPTDPDPPNPNERAAPAANYGDAFESWDGKPSEVRTIATVGKIRLGVARVATVRDEAKVAAILEDLGKELQTREKGRRDDWEARARDYHDMMDSYGRKLSPYMTGDFAFHTGQWVLFQPTVDPSTAPAPSASQGRGTP